MATGFSLGGNPRVVEIDLEHPSAGRNEQDVVDLVLELFEYPLRQTDGSRGVASLGAVFDTYPHGTNLPCNRLPSNRESPKLCAGKKEGKARVSIWVIVGIVVLLALILIFIYNRLVKLRNRCEAAWAQIDVQLKRRHDLVPNLVETVKGYAAHERETLESVTRARQQAVDASGVQDQAQAENILTGALRQLFAVAEAYPDLKANENFLALQEELTGTESRIAFSRQFYNEQVLAYDNALEQVPTNLIAGMFSFEPRAYFEAEEQSRAVPTVDFGQGGGSLPPPTTEPPQIQG